MKENKIIILFFNFEKNMFYQKNCLNDIYRFIKIDLLLKSNFN